MKERRFQGERAAALFPLLAGDPEHGIFLLDDQSLAFGWLCQPLAGADQGHADRLTALVNQEWPTDTLLQVLLWASPDIEGPLAVMNGLRTGLHQPLLRAATAERAAFLRAGVRRPIVQSSDTRVRDVQVLVTVKLPLPGPLPTSAAHQAAIDLRASTEQVLITVGLQPRPLMAGDISRIMNTLLNWDEAATWRERITPEVDPTRLLREHFLDPDQALEVDAQGLTLGEYRVQTLSVKRFPDRLHFGLAARYLSDPFSGARGISNNLLVCLNLFFPEPESTRSLLQTQSQWATNMATGPIALYLPRLAERARGFRVLFERLDAGDRPVKAHLGLVLFAPKNQATAAASNLRTYWRELGFQVVTDRFFTLPLFLNCLPFGADRSAIRDMQRYRTLAATHAVNLMPVLGDWKGTGTPVLNLISRGGQLMNLSLFDSASNYNACIAAQSGSGKSFLTNELISTTLSVGGRCWVVDVGRSYEKLCDALDGQFLAFTRESRICLNPFALVQHWEEEADMIAALVGAMIAPSGVLDDYAQSGLKRVLKSVWDSQGQAMTIDAIAEALVAEADVRLRDLGTQLYPFTAQGEYGRFFNGPNSIEFSAPFVVLELEELKGRKHLQQVVLLQLIYQIQQAMYLGERDQAKLVIIDEAWDLLTQGDVARFIETGYRRFRKYRGAAVTVTQSLNDLYTNPTGRAIAENSAHTFLLAQPAQAIDQLQAAKRLPLTEGGAELLKTVHTIPGAYSEILVIGDQGAGIGRLVVDPFRRLLYSTHPRDVAALNARRRQGCSIDEAIRQVLQEQAYG
ncbi:type IV secretion system protein TraC [Allochromatium humboldtianum]|uniref:Type IV secretion system protein TraC n=1 Tax=Allochromatium humboldtianum TaxID=504901 RepID=A0A850R5Y3_9GAMM|nr:type IV secretion system protein TraC [Allochromatium humboldtianum]NVZ08205.1 type IV secretion system protein TraC [Allochromatium humboldtianum]